MTRAHALKVSHSFQDCNKCDAAQLQQQACGYLDVAVGNSAAVAELQRHQQLLQQAACFNLRQTAPLGTAAFKALL